MSPEDFYEFHYPQVNSCELKPQRHMNCCYQPYWQIRYSWLPMISWSILAMEVALVTLEWSWQSFWCWVNGENSYCLERWWLKIMLSRITLRPSLITVLQEIPSDFICLSMEKSLRMGDLEAFQSVHSPRAQAAAWAGFTSVPSAWGLVWDFYWLKAKPCWGPHPYLLSSSCVFHCKQLFNSTPCCPGPQVSAWWES